MTQEQFTKLPALLTRQQFLVVTGLSLRKLREYSEAGLVKRFREKTDKYSRYYKRDAARISGFTFL